MKSKFINAWINTEIKSLKKIFRHSKIKFFILALINILINIATIITAITAVCMLIMEEKNFSIGVILAALSAGSIVILFFLNSFIVIYRSFMKSKFYEVAINKIEMEIIKHSTNQGEYVKKDANSILLKNVEKIRKSILEKKINKNTKSILFKSLMGETNV